jgi:hypothetical protein
MQRVRADGIARLDALDGGRAEPIADPLARSLPEPFEYPLAMVEWHDAWFDFDQEGPDDCRHDYLVRTVGFLVGEGPRFVSLAQELLPDGEGLRAVTHIPIPIVERIVRLDPSTDLDGHPGSPPLASG